jgi:hypothetical protein
MCLANMKGVDVRQILHFKENLSVLLISGLFIVLAARLDLSALLGLGPAALLVLALIQFVARPLNVLVSSAGSSLNWRERALLAWIAPRGIVAAAVSAIFAIRPLARLLKVAEPAPSGFLIVGANPVARAIGAALKNAGSRVLLTDSSWENIRAARMDNLPTYFGNPTSQHAEAHLDLVGLGHLLALSPSGELNTLACMRFRHEFGARLFSLTSGQESRRTDKHRASDQHRGHNLSPRELSYPQFAGLLSRGAEVRSTLLSESFGWEQYQALYGNAATLLFARDPSGWMHVASSTRPLNPAEGWLVIALIEEGAHAAGKEDDRQSE